MTFIVLWAPVFWTANILYSYIVLRPANILYSYIYWPVRRCPWPPVCSLCVRVRPRSRWPPRCSEGRASARSWSRWWLDPDTVSPRTQRVSVLWIRIRGILMFLAQVQVQIRHRILLSSSKKSQKNLRIYLLFCDFFMTFFTRRYVFGPPGSAFGSVRQRYGSASGICTVPKCHGSTPLQWISAKFHKLNNSKFKNTTKWTQNTVRVKTTDTGDSNQMINSCRVR